MSDRVDTEAVRGQFPDHGQSHERYVLHRLCDEVDRLRGALQTAERALHRAVYSPDAVADLDVLFRPLADALAVARAALAEGDTERPATMDTGLVEVRQVRCPTCGSDDPARRGAVPVSRNYDEFGTDDGMRYSACFNPWHNDEAP